MRIGLITHLYPRFAGDYKAIFVANLARFLVERGHSVVVVTPRWPQSQPLEAIDGVTIYRFAYWGWQQGQRLGEVKGVAPLMLSSLLFSGIWTSKTVTERHNLDLLHGYWVVPGGTIAALTGKLTHRPAVATAAGSDLNKAAYRPIAGKFVRFTLGQLKQLMVVSNQLGERATELGLPSEKLNVLVGALCGLDLSYFPQKIMSSQNLPLMLYVGNFSPPKRVDTILRAMPTVLQQIPTAQLWLVGDGELRTTLQSLAVELGIAEQVKFLGATAHQEIPHLMTQAQILVHCSDHEGTPLTIMEAMACGLPVVASNVGGIPDVVKEGQTGYLLSPNDVVGFAERLITLLSQPDLARQFGQNGRAFAESHLSKEQVLAQIEAVYAAALK